MAKQVFRQWWTQFAEAVRRSWRTVALAIRIPPGMLLSDTRYWFQRWPMLVAASESAAEQLAPYKSLYTRKATLVARALLAEAQLRARIKLVAIVVGLTMAGGGWVWLAITAYTRGLWYGAISAMLFLLNALAMAPAAAFTSNPWRRLGGLAVFWATLSVSLLAADQWPSLDSWQEHPPSLLQISVYATGSVAAFCLLGTLLARLAFFAGDALIDRRRKRRYPETSALIHVLALIEGFSQRRGLGDLVRRRDIMWSLDFLVGYVTVHIPRVLTVRGYSIQVEARTRFDQAGSVLRGYQAQLAVSNRDTELELRSRLAEFAVPLVTDHYDLLPSDGTSATRATSLPHRPARLLADGLVAVLPLAIVATYPLLGFGLPEYLRQWLTGFAIVWLLAKILQLVDPLYGSTWDRVHTALNSPRPPN
jgi:hypothetical protein